jgi:CHAT domain-containing protein/Tfp pilus assembly protein PilF
VWERRTWTLKDLQMCSIHSLTIRGFRRLISLFPEDIFPESFLQVVFVVPLLLTLIVDVTPRPHHFEPQTTTVTDLRPLQPGNRIEREIKGNESHFYQLQLQGRQFIRVNVNQRGIDLVVRLFDPDGKKLVEADSFNGAYGPEVLVAVSLTGGAYRLELGSLQPNLSAGRYMISVDEVRAATPEDMAVSDAQRIYTEGTDLLAKGTAESFQQAYKKFEQALTAQRSGGFKRGEADTLVRMGIIHYTFGEKQKALEYFTLAVTIWHTIADRNAEATVMNVIGQTHNEAGEQQKGIDYLNRALAIFREVGDQAQQATALNNIGTAYYTMGDHENALKHFSRALPIHEAFSDKKGTATVLVNIAGVYESLGEYPKALESIQKALLLLKRVGADREEAYATITRGAIHLRLGNYHQALESYDIALTLARKVGDRNAEAQTLNDIGTIYNLLGERQRGLEYLSQSLQLSKSVDDRSREAYTLNKIGFIHQQSGKSGQALEIFKETLPMMQKVGDRHGQAQTLNYMGLAYTSLGDRTLGLDCFSQALRINREIKERAEESQTLSNLMRAWRTFNYPRLAIFYGKQAVNTLQEIRTRVQTLDKELQTRFLESKQDTYRELADLLIAEGRLPEAQRVLQMLKQQEYFDFIRGNSELVKRLFDRIELTPQEEKAVQRYLEIADRITSISAEVEKLQKQKATTPEGQNKLDLQILSLRKDIEAANITFNAVLRDIQAEFFQSTRKDESIAALVANRGLRADLREWGPNTVILSTIVGAKTYRVILTTPSIQIAATYPIDQTELNKLVFEFRQAVQNSCACIDPRPLGRRLYQILVGPMEKQLDDLQVKAKNQPLTVVWSLDGTLRYLPLAALWDGKRYLVERYRNVVITLASRTRLSAVAQGEWRGLGLGVSEAKEIFDSATNQKMNFSALPAVPTELNNVIRDESSRSRQGVIPGRILLNDKFTEQSMMKALRTGAFSLVHLASHFVFKPGDETQSFLLLGDGSRMTLRQIRNAPELQFAGVELLTLSACDTAMGGTGADGNEIESFAVLAQEQGAKTVVATLWPVADASTQLLMTELYRQRQNNHLTKSEALRRAQLRLLSGGIKVYDKGRRRGVVVDAGIGNNKVDPDKRFAHPYFWAPFILVGNWR